MTPFPYCRQVSGSNRRAGNMPAFLFPVFNFSLSLAGICALTRNPESRIPHRKCFKCGVLHSTRLVVGRKSGFHNMACDENRTLWRFSVVFMPKE
ncbi:hypothetical protein [Undibacterium squillarum]|uniref:hypothetical protein n=1 Tax=Undibacterium squillarum TaxID=1131567 RepID=UPI0035B211A3